MNEYKSCLIFNQKTNYDYNDVSIKEKLLKRFDIVIKYLKNIQHLFGNIMYNKSSKLNIFICFLLFILSIDFMKYSIC